MISLLSKIGNGTTVSLYIRCDPMSQTASFPGRRRRWRRRGRGSLCCRGGLAGGWGCGVRAARPCRSSDVGAPLLPSGCPLLFMAEKSCVVQTGHVLVVQSPGSGLGVVPAQVSWGHASHPLSHSPLGPSFPRRSGGDTRTSPTASWAAPARPARLC